MSLEQEIVTILNQKEAGFTLPKRHREFTYFDTVYTDLDHTTKDSSTVFWMLARTTYERDGVVYTDYTQVLPYVENPERLRAYFMRGNGNAIMLFNTEALSHVGGSVPLSVFLENSFFMKGLGLIADQKDFWDKFSQADLTEDRLFIFSSASENDYIGQPLDDSIVRTLEKVEGVYPYMTYFSYYNRGVTLLKNQYQRINSIDGKGGSQSTMASLWANRCTAFIHLPDANIDVFANVVTADGENVNQFYVRKDLTVDLRQAGLNFLTLAGRRRLYNDKYIFPLFSGG